MFKPSFGDFRDFDIVKYKNKLWVVFITSPKGVDDSNSFGLASSKDGIRWKEEGIIMKPSKKGFDSKSLWAMCLRKVSNKFVMYYSAIGAHGRNKQSIGMAYSNNLKDWKRGINNPILRLEKNNEYYSDEIDERHHKYPIEKPILFRDPYFFRYKDDGYLIFAAKVKDKDGIYNAGVGLAKKSNNGFKFLPPILSPGKYRIVECPALYKVSKKWLLLFCDDDNGVIRYAIGDNPFGSFKEGEFPVLPKLNYVGRIVKWRKKYLFYSHGICREGAYMAAPKVLGIKNDKITLNPLHV